MLKNLIVILFYTVVLTYSCQNSHVKNNSHVKHINVKVQRLNVEKELNSPYTLISDENYVFILDEVSNTCIIRYQKKGGEIKKLGPSGSNYKEIDGPWSFLYSRNSDTLGVYGFYNQKIVFFDKYSGDFRGEYKIGKEINYPHVTYDKKLIAIAYDEGSIVKISPDEENTISFTDISLDQSEGLPAPLNYQRYDRVMSYIEGINTMALATKFGDQIDIVELPNYHTNTVFYPQTRYPEYRINDSGELIFPDDLKTGYVSIASSEEYIYALYSGRSYDEKGDMSFYGNRIVMIDWAGRIIAELHSDYDLSMVYYDTFEKVLWGISQGIASTSDLVKIDISTIKL